MRRLLHCLFALAGACVLLAWDAVLFALCALCVLGVGALLRP